jgi:hypothetical protein
MLPWQNPSIGGFLSRSSAVQVHGDQMADRETRLV